MEKTKLETCIAILKILSQQPISKFDFSNVSRAFKAFPEECIVFLEHQKLVKQEKTGKNVVYKTTERGIRVLNYFDYHQEDHDTQITFRLEYQQESFEQMEQRTHLKHNY
jgi:hypothetical protein